VSDATTLALVAAAAGTSLLHTLIPDHWLPFVLVGRARGWSISTVAMASALAAVIHSGLSVLLGLVTVWIGSTAVESVGRTMEGVGAVLLVLFGVGYALWAWNKGGHFHPGGALLHRGDGRGACRGDEGHANPEHLHYHADGDLIASRRGRWGAVGLAVIVGINPCVLVLPVMLASASRGAGTLGLVATAYAVPTILLMVGLSVLGVRLRRGIHPPGMARFAEAGSGLIIALLGLAILFLEH